MEAHLELRLTLFAPAAEARLPSIVMKNGGECEILQIRAPDSFEDIHNG
jgi:hypothetical protein